MHDVASKLEIYDLDGANKREIPLPALGSAGFVAEANTDEIYVSFSSFAFPPAIYEYTENDGMKQLWQAQVPVKTEDIVTEQVFYTAKHIFYLFVRKTSRRKRQGRHVTCNLQT